MTSARRAAVEPLATFLAATAVASALFWIGQVVPLVQQNLHGAIAVVFLYTPALAARIVRRPFDYRTGGLRADPVGLNLKVTGLGLAVTWPLFFGAFLAFYSLVCTARPSLIQELVERFAPLCPRWAGLGGASFRLPPDFLLLAASQLVVVAVPEEFFFRGYLWTRLQEITSPRRTLLITSALFGVGHFLVDFDVQRLVVFFPGLVFGWMRARTGSIAAGALFHALCNLFSEVLHASFFR